MYRKKTKQNRTGRSKVAVVHFTIDCQVEIRTIKLVLRRHLTSVPACKGHICFYDFQFKGVHLEQRPVIHFVS